MGRFLQSYTFSEPPSPFLVFSLFSSNFCQRAPRTARHSTLLLLVVTTEGAGDVGVADRLFELALTFLALHHLVRVSSLDRDVFHDAAFAVTERAFGGDVLPVGLLVLHCRTIDIGKILRILLVGFGGPIYIIPVFLFLRSLARSAEEGCQDDQNECVIVSFHKVCCIAAHRASFSKNEFVGLPHPGG